MKFIPFIGILMLSLVSCHDRADDHNMPTEVAGIPDTTSTTIGPDTSTRGVQDSSTSIGYDTAARKSQ
ncbi:MAG TPA: hypothetical protein VF679_08140 [Pedobacter sp.]|jgi:hypothetical protein